jgi:hypothetical protein
VKARARAALVAVILAMTSLHPGSASAIQVPAAIPPAGGVSPASTTRSPVALQPVSVASGVFEESFDSSAWPAGWSGYYPGPTNRTHLIRGLDGGAISVTIPAGSHYGSRFSLPLEPDVESVYFRYWVRFGDGFDTEGTGKLPGPVGIYNGTGFGGRRSTPEAPGWSARLQFGPGPTDGTTRLAYYAYHLDQPGPFGEGMAFGDAGVVANGSWQCVEGHVALNEPGESNGRLRAWVNGLPAFQRSDLAFRRAGEGQIDINAFWFNVYFGGPIPSATSKHIDFDQVAVGPGRIGCGADLRTTADVTGDGLDDAVRLVDCGDTMCWSTQVGGPIRLGDPTLTPSDVVPTGTTLRHGLFAGDFRGTGRDQVLSIGRCDDAAPCWFLHEPTGTSPGAGVRYGTVPTTASGRPLVGDVDGDGLDDVIVRSSCDGQPCWMVQFNSGSALGEPAAAGDGAYFGGETAAMGVATGDVTGDGRADLVYRGLCGQQRPCWRVQASTGTAFAPGVSWGNTTGFTDETTQLGFAVGDLNGDDVDDLIYRGDCSGTRCWRALIASDGLFSARYWGTLPPGRRAVSRTLEVIEIDGNDFGDVSYDKTCAGSCRDLLVGTASGLIRVGVEPALDTDDSVPLPADVPRLEPERRRTDQRFAD